MTGAKYSRSLLITCLEQKFDNDIQLILIRQSIQPAHMFLSQVSFGLNGAIDCEDVLPQLAIGNLVK